jgi:hypothetical protein
MKFSGNLECVMTNTNSVQNFPRLGNTRNRPNEPTKEGISTIPFPEDNKEFSKEGFSLQ